MKQESETFVAAKIAEAIGKEILKLKTDAIAALPDEEKAAIINLSLMATTCVGIIEGLEQMAPGMVSLVASQAAAFVETRLGDFGNGTRDHQSDTAN